MSTQVRKALAERSSGLLYLITGGLDCLGEVADEHTSIGFAEWASRMKARGPEDQCGENRLAWLWDALCASPDVRGVLGCRLVPREDGWKRLPSVEVAPAGSRFALFLKTPYWFAFGQSLQPLSGGPGDAFITIDAPLTMGPAKGGRFSCHDVPCTLVLQPPQVGAVQQEADAMKVDAADVQIEDGKVLVSVRSLNHAYTKASLRLEPHRRGPGGRSYDHLALVGDNGRGYVTLEKLRCEAEERARQSAAAAAKTAGAAGSPFA